MSLKSALGRTRTCYLLIRNQLLYPDELQGRDKLGKGLAIANYPIIKMTYLYKSLQNKKLACFLDPNDLYKDRIRNLVLYPDELRGQFI